MNNIHICTVWTLLHNQTNQTNSANLAICAAFLVVKIISSDHFLLLTIISSHSMSIKSKKLEFFQNSKNLPYEYLDTILLITQKPGHFSASPLGYTLNISKCKK